MNFLILIIISSFFITTPITGYEIIESLQNKQQPDNIKSILTMISVKKGKTKTSKFISWTKNSGEFQLMWFIEPKQFKGTSFLNVKGNMTMWLPSYKKIRKISSKGKNKSFMNSDLSYSDFDIRDIDMYTYKKSSQYEVYDNQECYIIISFPKNSELSNYSKHKTWISKNDLKPLKEISFDQDEKPLKEKIFLYTKKDSLDIIESLVVKNLQKNTHTTLYVEDIKLDTDLSIDYFKEINLKRPPK